MIIKDLIVTGIVKLLRHANIDTLVVEKINSVTKEEIDTLKVSNPVFKINYLQLINPLQIQLQSRLILRATLQMQ